MCLCNLHPWSGNEIVEGFASDVFSIFVIVLQLIIEKVCAINVDENAVNF
jgi:hypothetical protein